MRLPLALTALTLALPTTAPAQTAPEALVQHYTCADGAHLAAAYINTPEGASYAVVVFDGTMTPMKAGLSGSGVRYVSLGAPKLVWHTKGDVGFLAHDDADMAMIANECTARQR
ncbi:MliC family protein [Amaricoccus sp.]|uniref:MliC family protein n=1 Tax=Amaricoccus sp. TaxID=1872485 RepID=UPI0026044A9A|nr:MliC family protein [Amaricoccus sp.]HRO11085.1 MliC family protein [Amaricoccus sp.]